MINRKKKENKKRIIKKEEAMTRFKNKVPDF
jgi:hypothetical protein